jgi:type I restriction enzyme M protein
MSDFVQAIAELEAKKAELESQIKAVTPAKEGAGEEGNGAADEAASDEDDQENTVDEGQLKAWKKELSTTKTQLKAKIASFTTHINAAVDGLTPKAAAELVLTILHNDMQAIVDRYVMAQRKQIVAVFEIWWDKYRVTLTEIEARREAASKTLQRFLIGLRYV